MDDLEGTDVRSLYPSNEYPDLDVSPNYLWVGTADPNLCINNPSSSGRSLAAVEHDGLEKEPFEGRDRFESLDVTVIEDNEESAWCQATGDADPDFELREDDSTSDTSMSTSGSAMTDDDSQAAFGSDLNDFAKDRAGRKPPKNRSCHMRHRSRAAPGPKAKKRGLRKPLEPSVEFKALHSQATMAFIDHDYEKAEKLALQAIHVNPEMFAAHSLLSEIHMARKDKPKALAALFNGAHTRPRDTQVWLKLAKWITERAGDDGITSTRDAIYCYSRVITVDKNNAKARHRRATLYRAAGQTSRAAFDYEYLLAHAPRDTNILRMLAEVYIDLNETDLALAHFERTFRYYRAMESQNVAGITWSDINIYVEICGYEQEYQKGVFQLKSLARWLVGRANDGFWDSFDGDDREWDREDQPRRTQVQEFVSGQHGASAYGDGLPIELRIKLGLYRLEMGPNYVDEAINHFRWLEPQDRESGAKLFHYPDLFREAADSLISHGLFSEALEFYEPLQQLVDYGDSSYFTNMAICYKAGGLNTNAMECYQAALGHDTTNWDAKLQLALLCQELGVPNEAPLKPSTLISTRTKVWQQGKKNMPIEQPGDISSSNRPSFAMIVPRPPLRSINHAATERALREEAKDKEALSLFIRMQTLVGQAQNEGFDTGSEWMTAAKLLIESFQSERVFFPYERYMRFYGYTREARKQSFNSKLDVGISNRDLTAADGQIVCPEDEKRDAIPIPDEFRGIKFDAWLDIFLAYALKLARESKIQAAYEIILSASSANVFYHSPPCLFLIHVCWFTCALIGDDEETLCNVARWFTKEYQFVTDGYRLFAALNRLCDKENSWYNSGPSQKYVLRQLKAMDFSLIGEARYKNLFQERASYTTKDNLGNPIHAADLDIGLLMLYGHILYLGRSYAYSINYFLRAYAIDPHNPMINLSLAIGYIHHAIKRQAENRHHLIMQGFAFLFAYHDIRHTSNSALERQEAKFNVARVYHMLGLTHLAIPYYLQCFDIHKDVHRMGLYPGVEDYTRETAIALQGIWAANGNVDKARKVTEEWLTL